MQTLPVQEFGIFKKIFFQVFLKQNREFFKNKCSMIKILEFFVVKENCGFLSKILIFLNCGKSICIENSDNLKNNVYLGKNIRISRQYSWVFKNIFSKSYFKVFIPKNCGFTKNFWMTSFQEILYFVKGKLSRFWCFLSPFLAKNR